MSVLIKNMAMPKNCLECPCIDREYGWCQITGSCYEDERPDDCPLVELPSKHGRLVDADAFIRQWCEIVCKEKPNCHEECAMYQEMDSAPTALEAEG